MIKKEQLVKDTAIFIIIITNIMFYFSTENPVFLFIVNMIIMLLIVIIANFSIISVKIIVLNWVLIAAAFQYITGESYGLLAMNLVPLYFKEMNIICLVYNLIMLIFINKTSFLKLEKLKILSCQSKLQLKKNKILILCLIAIVCCIIAFPRMPFTSAVDGRFNALLKGNAWNHIVVVALLFLLPSIKKSKVVQITYIFSVFWFLSHYERVDMMGVITAVIIVLFIWGNYKDKMTNSFNLKKNIKYIILIFLVVTIFIIVGDTRNGGEFEFSSILRRIFVQKTAADIAYNFTATIDFVINNGILFGQTLLIYIVKLVPFTPNATSTSALIQDIYNTAGGDFLLDDALINFGFIGVVCFALIECLVLMLILRSKTRYSFYVYLVLLATVFRVEWYSYFYIEKALFYFVPIMMILSRWKIARGFTKT